LHTAPAVPHSEAVATDYDTALTEVHRQLFGTPPADAAPASPPAAVVHNEGGNPPAALDAEAVWRDWALRVVNPEYRERNPVTYEDIAGFS